MRVNPAFVLALLALPAFASEEVIEVAGVAIRKGMAMEELRSAYPPEAIHVIPKAEEAVDDDFDMWLVHRGSWKDGGEIMFEKGVVWKATKNLSSTATLDTYRQFVLLNELLVRLTGGKDTCALIGTAVPQEIFPQSDTYIILPDRIVEVGTGSRGEGHQNVSIRESLRVNPVPTSEPVRKEPGTAGHCVLVSDN